MLLLERIVKGSDINVKSEDITADDTKKVNQLNDNLKEVKKAADDKISVQLLRSFCDVMKSVVKLPENLVKMSVHSRLIARGDEGEPQPLADKGGPKRNQDNRGYDKGGRGRGRGGYNDNYREGGRGRGRGGHGGDGFQTGVHQQHNHNDNW